MHRTATEGHRVLIAAPFGRDADSVRDLLADNGYDAHVCRDLDAVARGIGEHVGAVVLTEEALGEGLPALSDTLASQPPWSDVPFIFLASRQTGRQAAANALRVRLPDSMMNIILLERPLGAESLISAVASAMRSRQRQFDMRDRLRELHEGEAKFQAIANSIDQMVWSTLPDGFHDYYNQRWYDYTGVPAGSTDGAAWNGMFHPDDQERAWARWRLSLETGDPYEIEYRLRHRSGEYRWVLGRAQAMRDAHGAIQRWFGTCTEIGDLVAAREVLARGHEELERMVQERTAALEAEMANRERAEEALRQAQKMEAVGQLTGGIAHDFNNMLTGVVGSLDLMRRRVEKGEYDALDRYMSAAMTSAQRAATLTARLLAFGRRQSLDLKPVDLNDIVAGMEDLLRRTLGENIRIATRLSPVPISSRTDANQVENALLNLAINARDAMPDGGDLVIESRVATPEEAARIPADRPEHGFVALSITDTGTGMSPETLAKVFEPFFTTKPIGQGTGLGLSQIYGFARQAGGHVTIRSAEGRGTVVTLYLPGAESVETPVETAATPTPEGDGETVLVVEDEPLVRMLVTDVLEDLGYKPLEAGSADEAIPILESGARIDLLVTDVGLPGMNGRQLAEHARRVRPALKVLFVTGYAESAGVRNEFLGENMDMVAKPFAMEALAAKIRSMIEG